MKLFVGCAFLLLSLVGALAQTPESSPATASLDAVNRKLDEINTKIDALSQQLLKMEQQSSKPGVMIGEASPVPTATPVLAASASALSPASGNTHVVARGETLTSIAKQNKVSVEDLQKFNHIEDGRKLQAGQTIMIPTPSVSPGVSASPSPSPSVAE
jgi:LysM repeat protein